MVLCEVYTSLYAGGSGLILRAVVYRPFAVVLIHIDDVVELFADLVTRRLRYADEIHLFMRSTVIV